MSYDVYLLASNAINVAGGKYWRTRYKNGVLQGYTGSAWTTTFASVLLIDTPSTTYNGEAAYGGLLDDATDTTAIDPTDADGGKIIFNFVDSTTTPGAFGDQQAREVFEFAGTTITFESSTVTAQPGAANEIPYVDFNGCCTGANKPFIVTLLNSDGTSNTDYDGLTAELRVFSWSETIAFTETATIDGNSIGFTVGATHATSWEGERYKCGIFITAANQRIVEGTVDIESVPVGA